MPASQIDWAAGFWMNFRFLISGIKMWTVCVQPGKAFPTSIQIGSLSYFKSFLFIISISRGIK